MNQQNARQRHQKPGRCWISHREHDEVTVSLDARTQNQIRNIKQASLRMDAGEWITCIECDAEFQTARLKVLPTINLCMKRALANEHESAS